MFVIGAVFVIACDDEEDRQLHPATDAASSSPGDGGALRHVDGSSVQGGIRSPSGPLTGDAALADAGSADPSCMFPYQEGEVPGGYRGTPRTPTTPAGCAACESSPNNCPHDATGCGSGACALQPFCSDYSTAADRTACANVQRCVRQTNCAANGLVSCYCGNTDLNSCTGSFDGAVGPCKDSIIAGFPSDTKPANVVSGLTDVSTPAGGAMLLDQCDHDLCAAECVPYCR
jgi:hypothetical protein